MSVGTRWAKALAGLPLDEQAHALDYFLRDLRWAMWSRFVEVISHGDEPSPAAEKALDSAVRDSSKNILAEINEELANYRAEKGAKAA